MSALVSPTTAPVTPAEPGFPAAATDASFRLPLLVIFVTAAVWLCLGSVLALIASIKFHGPGFLADSAWLTYGRVRPAAFTALVYGFCIPTGLAIGTWIMARLGRSLLALPILALAGTIIWNLGVALALFGILRGDATGFEAIEAPAYASTVLFCGYALLGITSVLTHHNRAIRPLFVSQWFILAAVFWFPWILSTAILLLMRSPGRGVTQPILAWWYSANLQMVWMGLVGFGIIFYLVPKVTARLLEGRYTALFAFWLLLLAGGWTAVPLDAPVPAWLPAMSTVANSLLLLLLITVAHILYRTLDGKLSTLCGALSLRFVYVSVAAFFIAGLFSILSHLPGPAKYIEFTWAFAGEQQLHVYGYFAMALFAAIYFILPQIVGPDVICMRLAKAHLWLAVLGLALGAVPLMLGGLIEGARLDNPNLAFVDVMKSTLHFLRISTIGDLLILAGNGILLFSVTSAAVKFYRSKADAALRDALADIKPAGVKV